MEYKCAAPFVNNSSLMRFNFIRRYLCRLELGHRHFYDRFVRCLVRSLSGSQCLVIKAHGTIQHRQVCQASVRRERETVKTAIEHMAQRRFMKQEGGGPAGAGAGGARPSGEVKVSDSLG